MKFYVLIFSVLGTVFGTDWDVVTPLDDYVNRDDGYYSYEVIEVYDMDTYTMHVLNMTSQMWMDDSLTDEPIWWHYVSIAVPKSMVIRDAFMLYIGGGNKNESPPTPDSESTMVRLGEFAENVGAVAAYIKQVPFQPVRFEGDLVGRTEDQIIARTWRLYIEEIVDDLDVILLLPMAKAAKRATDTVIEYVNEIEPQADLQNVMPTGFSKRGWTTGLLACSDQRTFAAAPIVMDILNWNPNLHHMYMAYGGWSWAFQPYWAEEVSRYIDHPRSYDIAEIIDPMYFMPRIGPIPKMLHIASSDQFFLPDDTHYWWDEMEGIKLLQLNENADHGLGGHIDRLWQNLESFFSASHSRQEDFPQMEWTREETADQGTITLNCATLPTRVRGWWADTTNVTIETDDDGNEIHRRDFRTRTLTDNNPIVFEEMAVEDLGDGTYSLTMDMPEEGFRGFFIEAGFDMNGLDFELTTEIHIIPDILPWPKCSSEEECYGTLK